MASYQDIVLADSPNAYWRLNEASGTFADLTGNGHTATAFGGVTYAVGGAVTAGVIPRGVMMDGAVLLDGATAYLTAPDDPGLDPGDVFTLECWVNTTAYTVSHGLIGKGANAYLMWLVMFGNHLFLRLNKEGVATIVTATAYLPEDGAWHHLVATKNGAAAKLYMDASDVTGTVTNATCSPNASDLRIGSSYHGTPGEPLNGSIDEVAIYPTVLSQAQVAAHFAAAVFGGSAETILLPTINRSGRRQTISGLRPPLVSTPAAVLVPTQIILAGTKGLGRLRQAGRSVLRRPAAVSAPAAVTIPPTQVRLAAQPRQARRKTSGALGAPAILQSFIYGIPGRTWITEQIPQRIRRRRATSLLRRPAVVAAAPVLVPPLLKAAKAPARFPTKRLPHSRIRPPAVVAPHPIVLVPIRVRLAQQIAARLDRKPHSTLRPPTAVTPFVPPVTQPECGSGPLPWLKVGDTEVANAARTVEYLRNGLGSAHWNLGACDLCNILYRPDGCTPVSFVSPAADPAPWYTAVEPGATSFLGVVLLDLKGYDSTLTRVVTPKIQGLGGASFSGQRRNPREWKFRAALVSRDDQGAEYGLRWLTKTLESSYCDTCTTGSLTVRLVCPPSDCSDDTLGEWVSYDVALVDGPHEVEKWAPAPGNMQDVLAGCRDMTVVEWTMTAGNPFLYKPAETCLDTEIIGENTECTDICDFLFGPAGEAHCCEVTPPARGVLGSIITLRSVSGMNSVLLGAYAQCPGSDEPDPVYQMELSGVPAGGTVVVDSARHAVTVTAPDENGDLVTSDGSSLIVLSEDQPLQWIEVRDCDTITCFCARTTHPCSQGGDTLVSIQTQLREG